MWGGGVKGIRIWLSADFGHHLEVMFFKFPTLETLLLHRHVGMQQMQRRWKRMPADASSLADPKLSDWASDQKKKIIQSLSLFPFALRRSETLFPHTHPGGQEESNFCSGETKSITSDLQLCCAAIWNTCVYVGGKGSEDYSQLIPLKFTVSKPKARIKGSAERSVPFHWFLTNKQHSWMPTKHIHNRITAWFWASSDDVQL